MPRCWPLKFRSRKAGKGKLPDSESSASGTSLATDSKPEQKDKEKVTKDEKAEDKKEEEKKDDAKTDEKKDEDKKDDDEKQDDDEKKEEEGEKKIIVGSVSEAKNIYKGPSDDDGNWTWVDKYPDDVEEAAENEETAKYAVLVRNQKSQDSRKKLEAHSIVIQSPQIRHALAEIMADYPGVACELSRLEFEAPFKPFVHRWYGFCLNIPWSPHPNLSQGSIRRLP
jgi:hypothetical protein